MTGVQDRITDINSNIKRNILGGCRLRSSDSGHSSIAGCCEQRNETLVTQMAGM
jgi:hypothetical protein